MRKLRYRCYYVQQSLYDMRRDMKTRSSTSVANGHISKHLHRLL